MPLCHRAQLLSETIKNTSISHSVALDDVFLHYQETHTPQKLTLVIFMEFVDDKTVEYLIF